MAYDLKDVHEAASLLKEELLKLTRTVPIEEANRLARLRMYADEIFKNIEGMQADEDFRRSREDFRRSVKGR